MAALAAVAPSSATRTRKPKAKAADALVETPRQPQPQRQLRQPQEPLSTPQIVLASYLGDADLAAIARTSRRRADNVGVILTFRHKKFLYTGVYGEQEYTRRFGSPDETDIASIIAIGKDLMETDTFGLTGRAKKESRWPMFDLDACAQLHADVITHDIFPKNERGVPMLSKFHGLALATAVELVDSIKGLVQFTLEHDDKFVKENLFSFDEYKRKVFDPIATVIIAQRTPAGTVDAIKTSADLTSDERARIILAYYLRWRGSGIHVRMNVPFFSAIRYFIQGGDRSNIALFMMRETASRFLGGECDEDMTAIDNFVRVGRDPSQELNDIFDLLE